MHTITLPCSPFSTHKNNLVSSVIINQKFYNTKEPCSYMTHGEEEAQTKEERKEKSMSPSMTHNWLYIFFILGEGGETEGNNMRKIMKELCPNTTHRERNTTITTWGTAITERIDKWEHEVRTNTKTSYWQKFNLAIEELAVNLLKVFLWTCCRGISSFRSQHALWDPVRPNVAWNSIISLSNQQ